MMCLCGSWTCTLMCDRRSQKTICQTGCGRRQEEIVFLQTGPEANSKVAREGEMRISNRINNRRLGLCRVH